MEGVSRCPREAQDFGTSPCQGEHTEEFVLGLSAWVWLQELWLLRGRVDVG